MKAPPRKAEPVPYEAVLKFVESLARLSLIDNAVAEPYLYVRCAVLAEEALAPPTEKWPLFNMEDFALTTMTKRLGHLSTEPYTSKTPMPTPPCVR